MQFIKVKNPQEGQVYLAQALLRQLNKDQRLVWLVSGGSNIAISKEVRKALPSDKLKNLTLALIDERYGPLGHSDSNHTQLKKAGFDFKGIKFVPVITGDHLSLELAAEDYERRIKSLFKESDMIIGQFGIGSDSHTAGILPHSPASKDDERLVIGYHGPDFKRITLSFKALRMVDEAYIFAFGEDKLPALSLLRGKNQPLNSQPAQIFRQSPPKSFIINNMIGDRI